MVNKERSQTVWNVCTSFLIVKTTQQKVISRNRLPSKTV